MTPTLSGSSRATLAEPLALGAWLLFSAAAVLLVRIEFFAAAAVAVTGGLLIGIWLVAAAARRPARAQPAEGASVRGEIRRAARWIDRNELLLLAAASPFFLFPLRQFTAVIVLIPLLWLSRWLSRGYVTRASPLNLPVLCLFIMLIPAFLAAADLDLAAPKLVGLLFGIGVYGAVLNLQSRNGVNLVIFSVVLAALVLALVSLVGTDWPVVGKLSIYSTIYEALPRLIPRQLPRTISAAGVINTNQVGGTLAWTIPFVIGLWIAVQSRRDATRSAGEVARALGWQLLLIVTMLISGGLLLLTQSRTAIAAVTLSLPVLLAFHLKAFRTLLAAGMLIVIALPFVLGTDRLTDFIVRAGDERLSTVPEMSLSGRLVIWQQGMQAVRVYPLAGVGLNNFDVIRSSLGVPGSSDLAGRMETHAHNLFLQAAVDFGLPGLVAYVALLASAFGCLLLVIRRDSDRFARGLATALCVALLAHQMFGMLDAITLGAKPGVLLWAFLGLTGWLFAQLQPTEVVSTHA